MGVAQPIVEWLRAEGHDTVHLREEGHLDFGEIVALSGERVVSVILFRLHNTRTPHVRERLQKVLAQSAQISSRALWLWSRSPVSGSVGCR